MRDLRNSASKEAVRLRADARRQREAAEETARLAAEAREAKLRNAFRAKPQSLAKTRLDNLDVMEREKRPSAAINAHKASETAEVVRQREEAYRLRMLGIARMKALLLVVDKKAPRLVERETLTAIERISTLEFVREPDTWKPKGKGRDTLFKSLCEHVLAKYPMPPFLWSAFFETENVEKFIEFVRFVGGGGSVSEALKNGLLPVSFTRKMCHDFMTTPADVGFFKALRRTQVRSSGGDDRFLSAWMNTQAGNRLHTAEDEAFWSTVIEWFAKNPMMDRNQVGPMVDYIVWRRRQDRAFSIKGRGVLAMMRGMEDWHNLLAQAKTINGAPFRPSGFKPFELVKGHRDAHGNFISEVWKLEEILNRKTLDAEGRVLKHCVYSYVSSIESGRTSIWSLTLNGERMITVEVRNDINRIVQARGKMNRQSTAREFSVITEWANKNGLQVVLGRW